jgi:plastocyanin/methionine-rich copper-binding protein CopC
MHGLIVRRQLLSILWGGFLAVTLALVACGTSAAPTPEAMMKKETPTPDAMMKKDMPTPDGMMMTKGTPAPDSMMKGTSDTMMMQKELPNQLFVPHFVNSSPQHGEVFRQAPETIVINFNFNLHDKSSISVTRDGAMVAVGKTTIDQNRLAMRATLGKSAGDGLYVVSYKGCWPDGSCHDGQFAFRVDSKMAAAYQNMTGKPEVTIPLENLRFSAANLIISKGTEVTWTNRDAVEHFVNSDPHPSHNVLPSLNSTAISQGRSYSFTFNDLGEWGYHCSAHVPQGMVGHIIVQ